MLNLLTNAADAMDPNAGRPKTLSVSSTVEGTESILLSVRDTGVGIDPEALEQIFEAFFTTKQTGMGMGLAISRWIVTSHGGQLWASRNRPCGTTFFLRLPIQQASDRSWPEPALEGGAREIA
jgi:signal transduction histidine kinase